MGLGSKLKRSVKKAVKKVANSAKVAVTSPTKIVGKALQGDVGGAVKQVGKFAGAGANLSTGGVFSSGDFRKVARNKKLNKLTLGAAGELAASGKGFNQLESRGETNSDFYKAAGSLGAKIGVAVAAPGIVGTAQSKLAALKASKAGQLAGALGVSGKDLLKKKKAQATQAAPQVVAQAEPQAAPAKGSNLTPYLVGGALALTGVGAPIAIAGAVGSMMLKKKNEGNV